LTNQFAYFTISLRSFVKIGECLIEDWQAAGLLKPSAIKEAISTIEQTLVLKKLGRLSSKDLVSMENTLKNFPKHVLVKKQYYRS